MHRLGRTLYPTHNDLISVDVHGSLLRYTCRLEVQWCSYQHIVIPATRQSMKDWSTVSSVQDIEQHHEQAHIHKATMWDLELWESYKHIQLHTNSAGWDFWQKHKQTMFSTVRQPDKLICMSSVMQCLSYDNIISNNCVDVIYSVISSSTPLAQKGSYQFARTTSLESVVL